MNFIHMFNIIDKGNSGAITKTELSNFMQANNFPEGFVDRWMLLFDFNKRGYITMDDYCERLGLVIDDDMSREIKKRKKSHLKFDDFDEFVDVDENLQQHIISVSTSKPLSTPTKPKGTDYSFPLQSPNLNQMQWNFENISEDIIEEVIVQKVAVPLFGIPQSKKKKSYKEGQIEEFEESGRSNKPVIKHSSSLPKHQGHSNVDGELIVENVDPKSRSLTHHEHGLSNESHVKPNIRHKSDITGKSKVDRGSKIEKVERSYDNMADSHTKPSALNKADTAKRSKKDKHKVVPDLKDSLNVDESISPYDNSPIKEKSKSLNYKINKKNKNKDLNEKKHSNEDKLKEKGKSSHVSKSLGNITKHLNKAPDKSGFEDLVTPSEKSKPSLDKVLWKSTSMPNAIEKFKISENEFLMLNYPLNDSGSGFIEGSMNNNTKEFIHNRSDYSHTLQDTRKGILYRSKSKEDEKMKLYTSKSLNGLSGVPFIREMEKKNHTPITVNQNKVNSLSMNKLLSDGRNDRKRLTSASSKDNVSQNNTLKKNSKSVDIMNSVSQYDIKTKSDRINNNSLLRGNQINVKEEKRDVTDYQLVNSRIQDPKINKSSNDNLVNKSVAGKDNPSKEGIVLKDLDKSKGSIKVNKEIEIGRKQLTVRELEELKSSMENKNTNKNQAKDYDKNVIEDKFKNDNIKLNYKHKNEDIEKQVQNTKGHQEFNKDIVSKDPNTLAPNNVELLQPKRDLNIINKNKPLAKMENKVEKNAVETNLVLFPEKMAKKDTRLSQTGSKNSLLKDLDKNSKDNLNLKHATDDSNEIKDKMQSNTTKDGREIELEDDSWNISETITPSSSIFQYSVPHDTIQKDHFEDIKTKDPDNLTKFPENRQNKVYASKELKVLHKDINDAILSDLLKSIVDIYEESVSNTDYNCAESIKHFLDRYYNAMWHVVINDEDYELYFSYEDMVIFQYDKLTFIIWKSGDPDY